LRVFRGQVEEGELPDIYSASIVAICMMEKTPTLTSSCSDAQTQLDTALDAVICMYGSIGFVRTADNLRVAMGCVAAHLRPGGLALITPWGTREHFEDLILVDAIDRPDLKIARMEQVRLKEPQVVEVTFHHLPGAGDHVTYHKQWRIEGPVCLEKILLGLLPGFLFQINYVFPASVGVGRAVQLPMPYVALIVPEVGIAGYAVLTVRVVPYAVETRAGGDIIDHLAVALIVI